MTSPGHAGAAGAVGHGQQVGRRGGHVVAGGTDEHDRAARGDAHLVGGVAEHGGQRRGGVPAHQHVVGIARRGADHQRLDLGERESAAHRVIERGAGQVQVLAGAGRQGASVGKHVLGLVGAGAVGKRIGRAVAQRESCAGQVERVDEVGLNGQRDGRGNGLCHGGSLDGWRVIKLSTSTMPTPVELVVSSSVTAAAVIWSTLPTLTLNECLRLEEVLVAVLRGDQEAVVGVGQAGGLEQDLTGVVGVEPELQANAALVETALLLDGAAAAHGLCVTRL